MKDLINKIKKKPELAGISPKVIEKELSSYLKKYSISLPSLEKSEKIVIKEVRNILRRYTGQYQSSPKKRAKLIKDSSAELALSTHKSTSERVDNYEFLKSEISNLKPKSILDLGCGLNPLALATNKVEYFASDINEAELEIIKDFFNKKKIKGKAFVHDLNEIEDISTLPQVDMVLILKVLDLVNPKYEVTNALLKGLKAKTIIVSFPTKKLSGKPMNEPRRIWFQSILDRGNYDYQTKQTENETFYIISLNN